MPKPEHMKEQLSDAEYKKYVYTRVLAGVMVAVILVAAFGTFLFFVGGSSGPEIHTPEPAVPNFSEEHTASTAAVLPEETPVHAPTDEAPVLATAKEEVEEHAAHEEEAAETGHGQAAEAHEVISGPPGTAFVTAAMHPIHDQLDRFWGWRPNDFIEFTDNVNNFQLGVLEVTRRTARVLAESLSRTGSNDAFDPNLEQAMNLFMQKADNFWFPSSEKSYQDGIREWETYRDNLIRGQANFFNRTDNLIPLLVAYADLLGSCDENLAKAREKDGRRVSTFAADDYFYYAKGVAWAIGHILEAVAVDFAPTLEARRGMESLHHAIEYCNRAASMDPLMVFEGDYDGFLANHRANMAAPISHARFHLAVLIKTLTT